MSHLQKLINYYEHHVMVTDTREVGYKVHGERGPRSTGKWKWVEKAVGTMVSRFGADTNVTCLQPEPRHAMTTEPTPQPDLTPGPTTGPPADPTPYPEPPLQDTPAHLHSADTTQNQEIEMVMSKLPPVVTPTLDPTPTEPSILHIFNDT